MMRIDSFPFRGPLLCVLAVAAAGCARGPKPDAYGNIEATEVVVGSQAAGQLERFTPDEGNVLPLGATVGVIDTSSESLQLEQASAQRTASASRAAEMTKQIENAQSLVDSTQPASSNGTAAVLDTVV